MKEKKEKKRFPKLLLCLVLILAIFVSGVTTPGFLLPLFGKQERPEKTEDVPVQTQAPYPGVDRDGKGHSSAFTLNPEPGLTVSAPENAFYEETSMTVTSISESELEEYQAAMNGRDGPVVQLFRAWRADAGLSPEDFMPGKYTVTVDLAELGVPEEMWPLVGAFHISDDKQFIEYATERHGPVLSFESRQNPVFSLGFFLALGAGLGVLEMGTDYGLFQGVWLGFMDGTPVYENQVGDNADSQLNPGATEKGRKLCTLQADSDVAREPVNRADYIMQTIRGEAAEKARVKAQEELDAGIIQSGDLYKRKLKLMCEYIQEGYKAYKPELAELCTEASRIYNEEGYTPQMLKDIGSYVQDSYKYLTDKENGAGIELPTYAFDLYLKRNYSQDAMTSTTFTGGYAYIILRSVDYEQGDAARRAMKITIVHEMVHVSQSEYKLWSLTDTKFNEATAQLIEMGAAEHWGFTDVPRENAYLFNMFGVPMDGVHYQYENGEKNADKSDSGYVWWQFLKFLMNRNPEVTYANILEAYRKHWGHPAFSTLVITAFHLENMDNLRQQFIEFCDYKQDMFKVASSFHYEPGSPQDTFPVTYADQEEGFKNRAFLYANPISMRVRRLVPSVAEGDGRQYGMLLVTSPEFGEVTHDLIPVGNKNCVECKNGVFYNPVPSATLQETYMLEVDTKICYRAAQDLYLSKVANQNSMRTGMRVERPNDTRTYYDVYTLIPPDEIEGKAEGQYLTFKLPEASLVGKKKYVDGYRVTVKANEGMETPKELWYPIADAGKEKKIKLTELIAEDLIERVLLKEEDDRRIYFSLSVCEYIEDADGTKHFGPESHQSGMDELLSEMMAMEGEITISIYWPTKDDLDLHCITPDGSHIYFSNPMTGGGVLDVDMQVNGESDAGAENIYFSFPVNGEYEVYVDNYTDRTEGYDSSCRIRIKVGQRVILDTTESVGSRSRSFNFTYQGAEEQSGGE